MPFLNTNIPELSGFDTGICLSNLDVLAQRQERISASGLAILSELADAILRDAEGDPDTVDSILLSLQSSSEDEVPPVKEANASADRELLRRMFTRSALLARLMLYRLMEEKMPRPEPSSLPSPLPASVRGRVAYMPGAFADKAYLRLTAPLKNPRAASTASFVDACEEVHSGLCEYCILPLENAHSGRLTSFTRLIIRYRLEIVAVCDLENGAAEGQSTRFALLRNAVEGRFPTPLPSASPTETCLEVIHLSESPSVTDLLAAAEFCGLTMLRTDTLPPFDELTILSEDSTAPAVACVFSTVGGDLHTFRRFLSLEAPEDMLVGLYGTV